MNQPPGTPPGTPSGQPGTPPGQSGTGPGHSPGQARPAGAPGAAPTPAAPQSSKIQHTRPGIGPGAPPIGQPAGPPAPASAAPHEPSLTIASSSDAAPPPTAPAAGGAPGAPKITMFGRERQHDQGTWARTPNTTGSGAIHVKTFHCKLTEDALQYMDVAINEWLDAHPQYEVKFVGATIGTMTGKLKEPALICQVWV